MPEIDQLVDGNGLQSGDQIPVERSAGTRRVHGLASDPPQAADSGTDAFQADLGRDVETGEIFIVDFDSANTTTTPTFENTGGTPAGALTITDIAGNALWASAINGVHELQYASGTDTYLLLNPLGTASGINNAPMTRDSSGRCRVSDPSADKDIANKIWTQTEHLQVPGTSSDPALALNTWRTPNANRPVQVVVELRVQTDGTTSGELSFDVDESGGTTVDFGLRIIADAAGGSDFDIVTPVTWTIPAGGSYKIDNVSDPNSVNAIEDHREFTL